MPVDKFVKLAQECLLSKDATVIINDTDAPGLNGASTLWEVVEKRAELTVGLAKTMNDET